MLFATINVMIIMDFSQNNQKKSPKKEKIGTINSTVCIEKGEYAYKCIYGAMHNESNREMG